MKQSAGGISYVPVRRKQEIIRRSGNLSLLAKLTLPFLLFTHSLVSFGGKGKKVIEPRLFIDNSINHCPGVSLRIHPT